MANTEFGKALIEGLEEAAAWVRGEIALETRRVDPTPPDPNSATRKKAAALHENRQPK